MKRRAGVIAAAALVVSVGCAQTDAGISTSVKSQFAADDLVKAYQIDVDTRDHIVTLSGEVESRAAKDRAMQLAAATDGVASVIDHVVIRETAATSGDVTDDAKRGVDIVKDGARQTGSAVKEGAVKVKEGAEKIGTAIVDSVTDKDRDSDKDGK